jgi:hypothetical protein
MEGIGHEAETVLKEKEEQKAQFVKLGFPFIG